MGNLLLYNSAVAPSVTSSIDDDVVERPRSALALAAADDGTGYMKAPPCRSSIDGEKVPTAYRSYTDLASTSVLGDGRSPTADVDRHHHLGMLLYLMLLCPLTSAVLALYSILALVLLTVVHPLARLAVRSTLSSQIVRSVVPAVAYQLRRVDAPPPDRRPLRLDWSFDWSFGSDIRSSRLVCVAVLGPFYALFISGAAWLMAAFWTYTSILGEPIAGEKERDGREAFLMVRLWWVRWLVWGFG